MTTLTSTNNSRFENVVTHTDGDSSGISIVRRIPNQAGIIKNVGIKNATSFDGLTVIHRAKKTTQIVIADIYIVSCFPDLAVCITPNTLRVNSGAMNTGETIYSTEPREDGSMANTAVIAMATGVV